MTMAYLIGIVLGLFVLVFARVVGPPSASGATSSGATCGSSRRDSWRTGSSTPFTNSAGGRAFPAQRSSNPTSDAVNRRR